MNKVSVGVSKSPVLYSDTPQSPTGTPSEFTAKTLTQAGIPFQTNKSNFPGVFGPALVTLVPAMRKRYLRGVPDSVVEAQRQHANRTRLAALDRAGVPANHPWRKDSFGYWTAAPNVLPYNGITGRPYRVQEEVKANPKLQQGFQYSPLVSIMPTTLFPSILDSGSKRSVETESPTIVAGSRPFPANLAEALRLYPKLKRKRVSKLYEINNFLTNPRPLSVLIHELLHPLNPVHGTTASMENVDELSRQIAPYAPSQPSSRQISPAFYMYRNGVSPIVEKETAPFYRKNAPHIDYFGKHSLSPRQQYFTGLFKAPCAHLAEAGTGTAQLVANEMMASHRFPTSYRQMLDMAQQRGALTAGPDGQIKVDHKKFFPDPESINAMSSGLDDFIEAENLYRLAERDYKNSFPGIYVDNHTGKPNVRWVMPWESVGGDFAKKLMNRMARENAMKYRANMDQLIGGAYL